MEALQRLESVFEKVYFLRRSLSLLNWDAAQWMPAGSAGQRGRHMASLQQQVLDLLADERVGSDLDAAQTGAGAMGEWQAANLREMRAQRGLALAVSGELRQRLARQSVEAEGAWREARQMNSMAPFMGPLQALLETVREKAERLGQALQLHPYEALMQEYDPGASLQETDEFFSGLREFFPDFIRKAVQKAGKPATNAIPRMEPALQLELCRRMLTDLGFDFSRGRLDEGLHPCTEGGHGDSRITTHVDMDNPLNTILACLHECGHALYDAHLPEGHYTQPVGADRGMRLQEGVALMLEMALGRSRGFAAYLHACLAEVGVACDCEALAAQLLSVRPGLIRMDADETSYVPHILMRYDIERELLSGALDVADLEVRWSTGMERMFGITPSTPREGCLQDIHWSMGYFGYFQSYAFGAVYGLNMLRHSGVSTDGALGVPDFSRVRQWISQHIAGRGCFLTQRQLVDELRLNDMEYYKNYLLAKHS